MSKKRINTAIIITLCIALLLRLYLAPDIGYKSDMSCFKGWALKASEGLNQFYITPGFADYPPGYIYILYIIGVIANWLSLSYGSVLFQMLVKLPAIFADLFMGIYLYKIGKPRLGEKKATLIVAAYLFNPAIIINSAVWGQVDAVFVLPLVISLGYLYSKRLIGASVWFALCVLIKPQALMFTPIYLFLFYDTIIKERKYSEAIKSILISMTIFGVLIVPFITAAGPMLIIEKYRTTLASYPYASLNAFNLHTLFQGNWKPDTETMLGVSHQLVGNIGIVVTVIFAAYYYFRNKERIAYDIYYVASFIVCFVFTTVHKMHERYLFPAIICILIFYLYSGKKQFKWLYILFSIVHFINVAFVLYIYQYNNKLYRSEPIVIILSLVQVMLTVGLMVYKRRHPNEKEEIT